MKRTERHHLKENEFAQLAMRTRNVVQDRQRQIVTAVVAVVVVAVAFLGYMAWQRSVEGRASDQLAEAIQVAEARIGPPPLEAKPAAVPTSFLTERERSQAALTKFKVVADEYPSTDAGIEARYREAATWNSLGSPKEAATAYQQVVDKDGSQLIGQMARLGLAESQARAGQFDQAITIYNDLVNQKDDRLVETALLQLGRVYRDAGKKAEAEQTFNRLINEYPASQLTEDARREIDYLKKT